MRTQGSNETLLMEIVYMSVYESSGSPPTTKLLMYNGI